MALAAHFTPAGRFTTTTVETVRFERPHRVSFRLLRGPVPQRDLRAQPRRRRYGVRLHGELGTDLWRLGEWWGARVAAPGERAVAASLDSITAEAERRAQRR